MSATEIPPRRKIKRIKVTVGTKLDRRTLTYYVVGKRPQKGARVKVLDGYYEGEFGVVVKRWSLWRGYLYRVAPVRSITLYVKDGKVLGWDHDREGLRHFSLARIASNVEFATDAEFVPAAT